jgi:hypothetical protein
MERHNRGQKRKDPTDGRTDPRMNGNGRNSYGQKQGKHRKRFYYEEFSPQNRPIGLPSVVVVLSFGNTVTDTLGTVRSMPRHKARGISDIYRQNQHHP